MTNEEIPRKWEYIADQLRKLKAPKKVINAAVEIDNLMVKLDLGYNTPQWEQLTYYRRAPVTHKSLRLYGLVNNAQSCTACMEAEFCSRCKLGTKGQCTPRSRYADNYYLIVLQWLLKQIP